jgi:threonine 3-dehydrogenase
MRALVKETAGPGMVVREVPKPACGPNDVLIRVHYAGVCGTDLHIWEWDAWASARLKPPVVIGHEFSGEVAELGREAAAAGLLAIGDLVTAEGHIICGHCLQCRIGEGHLCRRTQIIGVDRDGAFAEYIAMPAGNVMKLEAYRRRSAPSWIRWAMPCTRCSRGGWSWGAGCSSWAAGRSAALRSASRARRVRPS